MHHTMNIILLCIYKCNKFYKLFLKLYGVQNLNVMTELLK
jgi:hypothetical protein